MDKLLIVTGASKGIGLATAELFAENGYRILNISRSPCGVEAAKNLAIDLMDSNWPTSYAADLMDAIGQPDQISLLHNAALMTKDSVKDLEADVLHKVLQLNVVAAAQLNGLVLPLMNSGSSIIFISSTLGRKAVANTHAYVVSKHASIGQMRATCQDLVGSDVHTAAICPGFTETEMLKAHLGDNPQLREEISSNIVLGRLVQPAEIASAVWFCSQNPATNGAILDVNNGQVEK